MTISKHFIIRSVVAVLGERDAPANFVAQGRLIIVEGDVEIANNAHERPASEAEVAAIFGAGHLAQLANIKDLSARVEALSVKLAEETKRANVAEQLVREVAAVDAQYDAHVKPLLQKIADA